MHWFNPTPEKEVWQGLHSRTKSERNFSSGIGAQGDSEAVPTGRTSGKVKRAVHAGGLCMVYTLVSVSSVPTLLIELHSDS